MKGTGEGESVGKRIGRTEKELNHERRRGKGKWEEGRKEENRKKGRKK